VHLGKCHVNGGGPDCDCVGGDSPLVVGALHMVLNWNRPSPPPAPVTLTNRVSSKQVNNHTAFWTEMCRAPKTFSFCGGKRSSEARPD
jgi:hypothetical protein